MRIKILQSKKINYISREITLATETYWPKEKLFEDSQTPNCIQQINTHDARNLINIWHWSLYIYGNRRDCNVLIVHYWLIFFISFTGCLFWHWTSRINSLCQETGQCGWKCQYNSLTINLNSIVLYCIYFNECLGHTYRIFRNGGRGESEANLFCFLTTTKWL